MKQQYSDRMGDGQTIAYKILGIMHHIAANRAEQVAATKLHDELCKQGITQREIDKSMVCALADGFMYGNWPWSVMP